MNYVVVTYQKKNDPNVYTLQYNYIIKDGVKEGEKDIENGMFYLAQVVEENGKLVYKRVEDENNLDNYSKLQEELNKAIVANEQIKDYEAAKKAVDAAESQVKALQEQLDKAKTIAISDDVRKALKDAFDEAQEKLDEAKEKKDALEDLVEEARKAVAGIDLSRFDKDEEEASEDDKKDDEIDEDKKDKEEDLPPADDDEDDPVDEDNEENPIDDGDEEEEVGPPAPPIDPPTPDPIKLKKPRKPQPTPANILPIVNDDPISNIEDIIEDIITPFQPVADAIGGEDNIIDIINTPIQQPVQQPQGMVLGARRDNNERLIDVKEEDAEVSILEEEPKPTIIIQDEDVALAASVPTKTVKTYPNWWWLFLLLLLLIIILKLLYDKCKKKD